VDSRLFCTLILTGVCSVNASPVEYSGNGHYYEYINFNVPYVSWQDARDAAASLEYNGMVGHLATIADAGENDLIAGLAYNRIGYLGASDAEVEGDWQWITGELWSYTHWAPDEPNNCCSASWNDFAGEDYLTLGHPVFGSDLWNDVYQILDGSSRGTMAQGYFAEYEASTAFVPVPQAFWLFGSVFVGFFAIRVSPHRVERSRQKFQA
jgi:hypothetical protein